MIDADERQHTDTEVTLGLPTLIGIFFGLVAVCGVFFAFGYSMGRHAPPPAAPAATDTALVNTSGAAKPSPNEPIAVRQPPSQDAPSSDTPSDESATTDASNQPAAAEPHAVSAPVDTPKTAPTPELRPAVATNTPIKATPAVTNRPAPASAGDAPSSAPMLMVQIAAISRQEDAEALVAALRHRGYAASLRTEPQDKLFHVQIGPFSQRADAGAMRQKLLADGYNAIIK